MTFDYDNTKVSNQEIMDQLEHFLGFLDVMNIDFDYKEAEYVVPQPLPEDLKAHIIRDLDDYWEVTFDQPITEAQWPSANHWIATQLDQPIEKLSFDWRDDQTVEVLPRP
jgi:hypothetical protein